MDDSRIAQLLELYYQTGDEDVGRAIYEALAPKVSGLIAFKIPKQDRDDLIQDVFYQGLKGFRTSSNPNPSAYFLTIARNRVVDYYRSKEKYQEQKLTDVSLPLDTVVHPDELNQLGTLQRQFYEAMVKTKIKPTYRDMVIWHIFCGLNSREIEEMLLANPPPGHKPIKKSAINTRIKNALKKVEDYLKKIQRNRP